MQGPTEPVLDMSDIQGIAIPGFFKPHHTLLGLTVPAGFEAKFKALVGAFADEVATAAQTLQDRRCHRHQQVEMKTKVVHRSAEESVVLLAVGFSAAGLSRLTPGAASIPSEAYQRGMVERSAMLGDPVDPASEGYPSNWVVGAPGAELDALIVVAGDHRDIVTARACRVAERFRGEGIHVPYVENGDVREGDERGHEHFGFDDGVSQPGMRGRASEAPEDFITDRHVDPNETPERWLFGYAGQDLVWPGEFVLGYPATSPDPVVPGVALPAVPAWTRNASFLVFRRLRQEVGLFWRTMRDRSSELAKLPGFEHLDEKHLASLLVGRWPSGAPLVRTPKEDIRDLGRNARANNYFYYDADTHPIKSADGYEDSFPMAKADPAGTTCPLGAHIRKVNVRDSGSDMGGRESTYNRRLLRVGVAFGKSLEDKYAARNEDPEFGNRGLLFLSVQASIEQQFEFLMSRWVNDPARPKMPGGNDMLIGQNAPAKDGIRRCAVFGQGLQQASVSTDQQWVIPTGGGYFLLPSISAIRDVIAK